MKNFTQIPNLMFENSQLSIPARYLYCILLSHCRQKDTCFPGQKNLAESIGCSKRHIRTLLKELQKSVLIHIKRTGFNRPNTYTVAKHIERNPNSHQIGSVYPLYKGTENPSNNTYPRIRVDNRGYEKITQKMSMLGLKKKLY